MKTTYYGAARSLFFSLFTFVSFTLSFATATQAQMGFLSESVSSTPYDSQMSRVERFITAKATHPGDDNPTLDQVNDWIRKLRAVPYEYTQTWKTPDEMQQTRTGDCKAKAVTLYYLMRSYGAKNLMVVIGRRTSRSTETHAWLIWKSKGRVFLLDPTSQSQALEQRAVGSSQYIPIYGFSSGSKFRLGVG